MSARHPDAAWLQMRLARVPLAVRARMEPAAALASGVPLPVALAEDARHATTRALAGQGEHAGAFHLLAADGFATLACQAALEDGDPDGALAKVLDRLIA